MGSGETKVWGYFRKIQHQVLRLEICSQFVLKYDRYSPVNVNWEEIQKLPKLSINIMKLSKELVTVQGNTNVQNSIKFLEIADGLNLTDRKKEATVFLSTQISRFNRDAGYYQKLYPVAEKYEIVLLAQRCAQFILYNSLSLGDDRSEIQKHPMVTKYILEATRPIMTILRNTNWAQSKDCEIARNNLCINNCCEHANTLRKELRKYDWIKVD